MSPGSSAVGRVNRAPEIACLSGREIIIICTPTESPSLPSSHSGVEERNALGTSVAAVVGSPTCPDCIGAGLNAVCMNTALLLARGAPSPLSNGVAPTSSGT